MNTHRIKSIKVTPCKVIHEENCTKQMRKVFKNKYGDKIVLSGTYAFKWTVSIHRGNSVKVYIFPNREKAMKEFNKLIK